MLELALTIVAAVSSVSAAVSAYYAHMWHKSALNSAEWASNNVLRAGKHADAAGDFRNVAKDFSEASATSARTCNDFLNSSLAGAATSRAVMDTLVEAARGAVKAAVIHSTDSFNASEIARKHAERAMQASGEAEQSNIEAANHSCIAESHAELSAKHAENSDRHSVFASTYANDAASHKAEVITHREKIEEHARSVGALSQAVADLAVQTKVKLVHRKDYNADGGNIGGR